MGDQPQSTQQQIYDTNAKSVEATRRIKALAEDTRTTGIDTMNELDRQGEALNRAEGNLDHINSEMNTAEENLDNLQKCCGLCICPWNKPKRTSNDYNKIKGKSPGGPEQKVSYNYETTEQGRSTTHTTQPAMLRVTNDEQEDEMEENINVVGDIAAQLKNMAVDMGNELDRQNDQIDRMGRKADANKARIEQANKQAQNILR